MQFNLILPMHNMHLFEFLFTFFLSKFKDIFDSVLVDPGCWVSLLSLDITL